MPLRYKEIADEAFSKLHGRPPEAPRAIGLAYVKTRPEFTIDIIGAGKGHLNVAEKLRKFVPKDEEIHTTTIRWRAGKEREVLSANEKVLLSLPEFIRYEVELEILSRMPSDES